MNSSSVTSQTWRQNFRPYVNGVKVSWPDLYLYLMAGECIDLTVEFEDSYFIGDPESHLKLCCEPDGESLGLVCDPPFGQLVEMAEGLIELNWHICARKTSGAPFELHFEMPLYQEMPPSPLIPGEIQERVYIDSLRYDRPVAYVGYEVNVQALLLAAPCGLPMPDVLLQWRYAGKSLPESISGHDGIASASFVPESGEQTLEVTKPSGVPDSKTEKIIGLPMPDATFYGLSVEPQNLPPGEMIDVTVIAQDRYLHKVLEGIQVFFSVDGEVFDMRYSGSGGITRTTFTPIKTGTLRISARLIGLTESSAFVDVYVRDA